MVQKAFHDRRPVEEVLYIFAGQKNGGFNTIFNTYAVVLTNKRILLATKRVVFGYFFKSITPDMYNDLTVHRGLIWGSITIDTVKEVIQAYQEVLSNGYKLGSKATKLYNKLDSMGTTAGHYYKGVE